MAEEDYAYPLRADWSTAEIVTVTTFYQQIEAAYERSQGVAAADLIAAYRKFQEIVPQKFEEKNIDREFEEVSGYSIYRTMKQARQQGGQVKMKGTTRS